LNKFNCRFSGRRPPRAWAKVAVVGYMTISMNLDAALRKAAIEQGAFPVRGVPSQNRGVFDMEPVLRP
jgi:hypothetical protein